MNINEAIDAAIAELDSMEGADPEGEHSMADDILLSLVPSEVRDAYMRLVGRCSWWACA